MPNIRRFLFVPILGLVPLCRAGCFAALFFLAPFAFSLSPCFAQINPGPCDTCYKNYVYDSTFYLGGHLVPSVDDGIDAFHFGFSQDYFTDVVDVASVLADTFALHWIADPANPWGGYWVDSAAPLFGLPVTYIGRVARGLRQRRFRTAAERGFKFIIHPGMIPAIMKSASVWENYLIEPEDFQSFLHCEFPPQDSAGVQPWEAAAWRRNFLNQLTGGFYWSYTVPSSSTPDTVMMAGRPDWVGNGFSIRPDAGWVYDVTYNIWHDAAGNVRPQAIADSLAALYDKRKWLAVEFAIQVNRDSLIDEEIDSSAVIAYADLFVRDRLAQETCKCRILRHWKRVEITKAEYLERFNFTADSANEYYVAHRNGSGNPNNWYFDIDTLMNFEPVWDVVTGDFGNQHTDSLCVAYCDSMLQARMSLNPADSLYLPPGSHLGAFADLADFSFRFYTTRLVPLGFLRSRLSQYSFLDLRNGQYDSLIAVAIDSLYAKPEVDSLVDRIGVGDEVGNPQHRAWGILSSKAQRAMEANPVGQLRPKKLWSNPPHNPDAFRLFAGDFDSAGYKQIHQAARQRYLIGSDTPIPIFYANTDSLSARARNTMFKFNKPDTIIGADTQRVNLIVGNHPDEYRRYRDWEQGSYGKFLDYKNVTGGDPNSTNSQGPMVPAIARVVDVFRFKYRDRFPDVPSTPVWNVVQTHGHVSLGEGVFDATGYDLGFGDTRIPTPEQITVSGWLSFATGVSGMVFGDFVFTGVSMGPTSDFFGPTSSVSQIEYGMLRSTNQSVHPDSNPKYRVDSMWLGFRSRAAAVAEVTGDLFHIDTTIGLENLVYAQQQMSVHDTRQSFDAIPMVRDLKTERAKRHDVSFDTGTGTWSFTGSDTLDSREETFIELTHFGIKPEAGTEYRNGERLLVIVNRLTYPIDTNVYSQTTVDLFDSLHPLFPTSTTGLGAIDVRRPVVVFQNNSDVIADSLIVEKISATDPWIDTVAFGDTVRLPWQLPGRGAAFLLRPVPALLSNLGTAYNNGVHAENPSSDTLARDMLVVYQRDSVVYARALDSTGAWSEEVMISKPSDTVLVSGARTASNFLPTVATCRNHEGATRIVWERRDRFGKHSVESMLLLANPVTRLNLAGVVDSLSYRQQIVPALFLNGPPNLAPVIVGVHDTAGTGGFVVACANRFVGIDVIAIREITDGIDTLASQDTVSIRRVHAIVPTDSICQLPTLAHVPCFQRMNVDAGKTTGTDAEKETDILTSEELHWYNRLHLGYQQGDGVDGYDEEIYYHPVGVIFPENTVNPPGLFVGNYEPVTAKIDACSFEHPSIAADSTRTAITFEVVEMGGYRRNVGLRFRDTAGSNQGTPLKAWETTLYRWGGPLTRFERWIGYGGSVYQRPSVTQFPSMDSLNLAFNPEGGLTWFWGNGPAGRAFVQFAYRYGWFNQQEVGDGKHPTMMLVPYRSENPFAATGIFHRGTDSTRVEGVNDAGDDVYRYSSRLLNTPGNPIGYFSTFAGGSGIVAGITVSGYGSNCAQLPRRLDFGLVFPHESITHPDDDLHKPGDPAIPPAMPGLPPSFFAPPGDGTTLVDTLATAEIITRTGLFATGNTPVSVRRIAAGGDSLIEWLNNYGTDSERGVPANVWAVLELVRASDSAVLWRSDTLDARGLDTLADPLDDLVGVPVDQAADSGTVAFIRLRGFATAGVVYDLYGGFNFYTEDSTTGGFQKLVRPRIEKEVGATAGEAVLSVQVIPNPARDRAEVRVRVLHPGRVRLAVYNTLGEKLADLPDLEANTPGEYIVEISLSNVRAGVYLLRAESGAEESTVRFGVVR